MDFVNGMDRDQLFMMDLESIVALDSWARVVGCFVDILPVSELGFNEVLNTHGRASYRASDML